MHGFEPSPINCPTKIYIECMLGYGNDIMNGIVRPNDMPFFGLGDG